MTATLAYEENKQIGESGRQQRDLKILNDLEQFSNLASKYVFGQVSSTSIDSGLTLRRPTLLVPFQ